MKKLVVAFGLVLALVGCKSIPTPDTMYTAAKSIGFAAGYTIKMLKISDEDTQKLLEVIQTVNTVVPTEGETYKDAWKKVATEEVAKLVDAGKVKESVGKLIVSGVAAAGGGVDHLLKKYPKAKDNEEVIRVGVKGVVEGITTVIKPINKAVAGSMKIAGNEVDYEAYFILSQSIDK